MRPLKPAEMQEANLTSMVLFLKRIDIAGLGHCDFMNRPGSFALGRRRRRRASSPLPAARPKSRRAGGRPGQRGLGLCTSISAFREQHSLKEFV